MHLRLKEIVVTLSCLFSLTEACAFGLSPIRGAQLIGKPLSAQIEVQTAPGLSAECIKVKPTDSLEDFFMTDVKVDVAGPVDARRIVLSSSTAITNPFISFVLDVRCGNLAMSREYQLLADYPATASNSLEVHDSASGLLQATAAPDATVTSNSNRGGANPSRTGSAPQAKDTTSRQKVAPKASSSPAPAKRAPQPSSLDARDYALSASGESAPKASSQATPPISEAPTPVAPKKAKQSADRLQIAQGGSQMQMAADALIRLEATTMERNKVTAELVSGLSSALNSIVELKAQAATQEKQMQQLIALQIESEKRRIEERESQLGPWSLFALVIGSTLLGAVLVTLFHRHSMRRQNEYSNSSVLGSNASGSGVVNDTSW